MVSIVIDRRFNGPPNSGNGGYVCGLLARHISGCAEVTLRAPPPLERPLDVHTGADGGVELRERGTLLATARAATIDASDIPNVAFRAAEAAVARTPFFDETNHKLPTCFVCGPSRGREDGLRIFAGPVEEPHDAGKVGLFAATWIPHANLAGTDGRITEEFVWAALDCPTGHCSVSARHLGMNGDETILLGRMSARVDRLPSPGDGCVIVAWPTGRDGRKLYAESALLGPDENVLAVARTTWLTVDRDMQLGKS